MADSLANELKSELQDLRDRFKLALHSSEFDPEHFGNAYLILQNDKLRFRLTRDRGDKYFQLAIPKEPDEWHDLDDVLEAMGKLPANQLLPDSWHGLLVALSANMDEIASFLNGPRLAQLKTYEQRKARWRMVEMMDKPSKQ
jgi:hypothetical protein